MQPTQIASAHITSFLIAEARLLDERRWEDWLALFTNDGWYWVPIEENQPEPRTTISLIYDDRKLLETRVRRLTKGALHAQSPNSRTTRTISNVTVEDEQGGAVITRAKFQMIEYRRNNQRLFGGTLWHHLIQEGATFAIHSKKVELVNCDGMMDGLNVPF
ncbi:MAG: phenylpropionate dioxygenase [Pelagibacteraceae bacterium]|nr:phenylpropionate dioxygenase [Pelagibacteraceae bacterium]PPR09963.1 MAG: 2-halobenzoate 1,2-dioxygenase small subunit [Alphaproteobacteria bacterium MarineAlpha11_Bin1]|tara:strand:- start:73 stop:555 length:483 start_codon:yes stop_codon:yes gene_type:complete